MSTILLLQRCVTGITRDLTHHRKYTIYVYCVWKPLKWQLLVSRSLWFQQGAYSYSDLFQPFPVYVIRVRLYLLSLTHPYIAYIYTVLLICLIIIYIYSITQWLFQNIRLFWILSVCSKHTLCISHICALSRPGGYQNIYLKLRLVVKMFESYRTISRCINLLRTVE